MSIPELLLKSSEGERRIKVERERTTLGRSRDADIFIPDQWLSRMHAEILLDHGGLVIADLGSKNGTLVNGSRIQGPTALQEGDQIKLGDHTVTVQRSITEEEDTGRHPGGRNQGLLRPDPAGGRSQGREHRRGSGP